MKRYIKSAKELKSGDFAKIDEWGKIQIDEVFNDEDDAVANGYDNTTSYFKNGYKINWKNDKVYDKYNKIKFGAYKTDVNSYIINPDVEATDYNAKFEIHNLQLTCTDLKSGLTKTWKIDYNPNSEFVYDFKKTKLNTNQRDMQDLIDSIVEFIPSRLAEETGFEIDYDYGERAEQKANLSYGFK